MHNLQQIRKIFQKIQVVRSPKYRLATFGNTRIDYQLVTEIPGLSDRSRLRAGVVTAQKPALITPASLKDQFQGFGDDVRDMIETVISQYGRSLRGLEYQFKNEIVSTRIELTPPDPFLRELSKEFDQSNRPNSAILHGQDKWWELAVMKLIVEETLSSFSSNMQELEDRGFFEGGNREMKQKKREIERLFKLAESDRTVIPVLGGKLKEYGLFEKYQDMFFRLVTP